MFKRNLALCIALDLLLSGCGGTKQNEDNMQEIGSENNMYVEQKKKK